MLKSRFTFLFIILLVTLATQLFAQDREVLSFNENWNFEGGSVTGVTVNEKVTLPHTWNAGDAIKGINYYRGIGTYRKNFNADESWKNKRVYIRFEGVNISVKVKLNNNELGEHKGGYAAFVYEITNKLNFDSDNLIEVTVSNEFNLDVPPLVGDFNVYGGIYRPVSIIVTDPVCISLTDYASPGVYLKQSNVSKDVATVEVQTLFSNGTDKPVDISYVSTIIDAEGNSIQTQSTTFTATAGESKQSHQYILQQPHLWNGKKDPYLYHVIVKIIKNGKVVDTKTEPLGLRFFSLDANQGFFLNGEHLSLRGVSRHQDKNGKASALTDADHKEDMEIMLDLGINALRLAHYQHAQKIYNMSDSTGLFVWAELPWVGGPSGAFGTSNGYEKTEAFHSNAKQQLRELIRQNYNHPSILMWSIFNEIQDPKGMEPLDFIKELNSIVKEEDPSRLSVGASMLTPFNHGDMHKVTDAIAWNRYYGWYYSECKDMGEFLDKVHAEFPDLKIGVSEYGAGASVIQHSNEISKPNPMGSPHPEEYQGYYHEEHLKIFNERPYVWGTFVWNMFDFGAYFRREGDTPGLNDKGLVTYDRKTKKDAFYFYKSHWSEEPVLHITSSRYVLRKEKKTTVKVYTNLPSVSLTINGVAFPSKAPENNVIVWENIELTPGNNAIVVKGNSSGKEITDSCVWSVEESWKGMNMFIRVFDIIMISWKIVIAELIIVWLVWLWMIRKRRRMKQPLWKRIIGWTLVVILLLSAVLLIAVKLFLPTLMGN